MANRVDVGSAPGEQRQEAPPRGGESSRFVRLPRDVSAYVRANRLNQVDGWQTTSHFAGLAVLYAVASVVAIRTDGLLLGAPALLLQGFVLLGCSSAWHEGVHGLLYRSERASHVAGALCGSVILYPVSIYRYAHLEHHRYTNVDGDTEDFPTYSNLFQYFVLTPLGAPIFFAMLWWKSIKTVMGRPPPWLRTDRARREVTRSVLLLLLFLAGLIALTAANPGPMVTFYWAPVVLANTVLTALVQMPEHYGILKGPGPAFTTTRSTTSNAIVRWFLWGANFHAAHHLHPGVPALNLGRVHTYIESRCEHVESSYIRWHGRVITELATKRRKGGR